MMFAELSRNVNQQDEDGWTPLMFAAKSGSTVVVQYLLQRGANPNMRQVSNVLLIDTFSHYHIILSRGCDFIFDT